MRSRVLILGGTSDIGLALARTFAAEKYDVVLAARNLAQLQIIQADLQIRHQVEVSITYFEAADFDSHFDFYHALTIKPDVVICVFGHLGSQPRAELDWSACDEIITTNYTGAVSILNIVANDFANRKRGTIVGISSVAGDRGRQSNYIYGSAKAAFSVYLAGLRNRMFSKQVHVLTVKPGFVKTKMTEHLTTPALLTASPGQVAKDVFKAVRKKKDVLYTLGIWRLIMFIIRMITEGMFKRMKM